MNHLSDEDKLLYDKLLEDIFSYNSLRNMSIAELAQKHGIPTQRALRWYSHMLKYFAATRQKPQSLLCPTCGKSKTKVNSISECRDVFHYL